jgi:hypothetical protein
MASSRPLAASSTHAEAAQGAQHGSAVSGSCGVHTPSSTSSQMQPDTISHDMVCIRCSYHHKSYQKHSHMISCAYTALTTQMHCICQPAPLTHDAEGVHVSSSAHVAGCQHLTLHHTTQHHTAPLLSRPHHTVPHCTCLHHPAPHRSSMARLWPLATSATRAEVV